MPIYEYRCKKGHNFELLQRIDDDPLQKCEQCGAPAERVLSPVAIHFKGKGFYSTDYGKAKGRGRGEGEGKEASSKDDQGSKDSKSSSSDSASDTASTPSKQEPKNKGSSD